MYSALLLLCALGSRGVASLILDIPQVLTPPTNSSPVVWLSNASNPTPSTLENLAQSFPALTSLSYECDKENFGEPTFDSCMDAYRQLPAGSHARSYGDRETQQAYDFPLPLRYASGMWWPEVNSQSVAHANDVAADGTCFIQVFPTIEGTSDLLKPLNLKQAVRYLIHKCVEGGNPEGGIAEKLGKCTRGTKDEPP